MKFDAEARHVARPEIAYDEALPISLRREEVAAAILQHQVVIICGETGSGKTTQLPKICLEIGRGLNGLIGHTQPRRIAARATAARIAQELKSELGRHVGFKIRFTDRVSMETYIKLMTDGILLAETQTDPLLRQYDTLIIDEAHERSLNIDFMLGYLKQLLPKRPDLKVIVTSATLDAERFSQHFASHGKGAPVIEVSGRLYPIETRYRPWSEAAVASQVSGSKGASDRDINEAIVDAVSEAHRAGPGDVLVFLPFCNKPDLHESQEIVCVGGSNTTSNCTLRLYYVAGAVRIKEANFSHAILGVRVNHAVLISNACYWIRLFEENRRFQPFTLNRRRNKADRLSDRLTIRTDRLNANLDFDLVNSELQETRS